MALVQIAPFPSVWPVTVDEARDHVRSCSDDDDAAVMRQIQAATRRSENFCERAFIEQAWRVSLDDFPDCIKLPRPRLIEITDDVIAYRDASGDEQEFEDYDFNADEEPCVVVPAVTSYWPTTDGSRGNVRIEYTAGYGTTRDDVPDDIRLAILMTVAHYFDNRGDESAGGRSNMELPPAVQDLLTPYRVMRYV